MRARASMVVCVSESFGPGGRWGSGRVPQRLGVEDVVWPGGVGSTGPGPRGGPLSRVTERDGAWDLVLWRYRGLVPVPQSSDGVTHRPQECVSFKVAEFPDSPSGLLVGASPLSAPGTPPRLRA